MADLSFRDQAALAIVRGEPRFTLELMREGEDYPKQVFDLADALEAERVRRRDAAKCCIRCRHVNAIGACCRQPCEGQYCRAHGFAHWEERTD